MAASAFAEMCRQNGLAGVQVDSAGTNADDRQSVSAPARQTLDKRGIPLLRLASRALTGKMARWADLIVTMTETHRDIVRARFAFAGLKTVTLLSFTGGGNVGDPFGGDPGVYEGCLEDMMPALDALVRHVRKQL